MKGTPSELLKELFGSNEKGWPTVEELAKKGMENPIPFSGQWIKSYDFDDGDLILTKWTLTTGDGMGGNYGPFWLIYIHNQQIISFSYPNYGSAFWFAGSQDTWWCNEVYGRIDYTNLNKTKFINWLSRNPMEVK
jgi:hypothetical protein